jgi:hypothetical protein
MAPRRGRSAPSRSRTRTPGSGQMSLPGLDYVPAVPSLPKGAPGGASSPEQARASINRDFDVKAAIAEAQGGDTSILLPYQPTPSINPPRPRTLAAGYDAKEKTLRVQFRNGQVYEYYDVPPNIWRNFKRVQSPGRAVNRVLNNFSYAELHL